jgi:hypothetical protein
MENVAAVIFPMLVFPTYCPELPDFAMLAEW